MNLLQTRGHTSAERTSNLGRDSPKTSDGSSGDRSDIIPPEDSASIARKGEEAIALRRRTEGPGKVGRYALTMIGVVTAGAGVAFWITSMSPLGLALGGFGVVLVALGVVQNLLYRRDLEHWPVDVLLWDEGLEVILANGEVRGATWSDTDFAIELVSRRIRRSGQREYLLLWLSESRIPPAQLSPEGFEKLARLAEGHGLQLTQNRHGSRSDATQVILIQGNPVGAPSSVPSTTGA